MPQKLMWTAGQDAQIRRLRAEGATWDMIAAALHVTRWTAIERGRRIGAQPPLRKLGGSPKPDDPARDPLPAGHPSSWGAITAGTALEGAPYGQPSANL